MRYIYSIILLTAAAFGQSAPTVVALSPHDATEAIRIHREMLAAEKRWDDYQKELGQKYLIVDRDSPNASDTRWYPKEADNGLIPMFSGSSLSVSSNLVVADDGTLKYVPDRCLTPEERAKIKADDLKKEQDRKTKEAEREAKSKRFRQGFDKNILHSFEGDEPQYIFSDDYSYLLPKPEEPSKPSPWRYTPEIATQQ